MNSMKIKLVSIVVIVLTIFVPEIVLYLPVPSYIENDTSIIYAIYYISKILLISIALYVCYFRILFTKENKVN